MTRSINWKAEYSYTGRWLRLPWGRMHYVDEGTGPPVLMVHGNPTWSFYWRRLIDAARTEQRAIAVDHLGCGLSEKPHRRDFPYTLAAHTENLCRFIREFDLRDITLAVHDWGGAIGLGAAVEMPDRFVRLVLLNTAAFPPRRVPLRIRACRMPLLGRWAVQGLNLFARAALWMAVEEPQSLSATAKAGLLAPYDSWQNRRAIYQFVKDIPLQPSHPTHRTLAELEERLPVLRDRPATIIWGMRDWCFQPWCLERFEEIFPDAEVHRLENVGHYVIEEAPEQVVDVVMSHL